MPVPDLPSFTRLLGVNVLHRSPERTEAQLTVREELCNRRGVLHGGAVMALGDTLGGMTASISLPDGGRTATIESKRRPASRSACTSAASVSSPNAAVSTRAIASRSAGVS